MSQGDEHIEHIKRALWSHPEQPGASVMVGAGFSLNAVRLRGDAPSFLTWSQLATRLESELGYSTPNGRGTSDALRLASEFESSFGPTELEKLLREAAPDEFYNPGPLHTALVTLPWADIFTTNYDQLLERASRSVPERRYSTIRSILDIPASARPRIVKLHGSFPSDRPFIVTEEHFRTYPQRFAPFVNLVRQSVMETVFCLLGFSGDDPNFLQWAGWVRDSLGPAAPPIYLCGVLDLTPPRQHLLRSRQIIPIDLGERFPVSENPEPDLRHKRALEWLLLSLQDGEPVDDGEWPDPPPPAIREASIGLPELLNSPRRPSMSTQRRQITPEATLSVPELCSHVAVWSNARTWYPGWTCLPDKNRLSLWNETQEWLSDPGLASWIATTQTLPAPEALLAWLELVWRIERALFSPVTSQAKAICQILEKINPYPSHIPGLRDALTPQSNIEPSTQWRGAGAPRVDWPSVTLAWIELAFVVARCAREDFDAGRHSCWMERLAQVVKLRPEWEERYLCEMAMLHLFRLEHRRRLEVDPLAAVRRIQFG